MMEQKEYYVNGQCVDATGNPITEEPEKRGSIAPIIAVLFLAIIVISVVAGRSYVSQLNYKLELANEAVRNYKYLYNEAREELHEVMTEDTELFMSFLEKIDAHERAFDALEREREYYKSIVPESQWYENDSEIEDIISQATAPKPNPNSDRPTPHTTPYPDSPPDVPEEVWWSDPVSPDDPKKP